MRKIISIILLPAALVLFSGAAGATSPMPGEEALGLQAANVCTVRIVYVPGKEVLRDAVTSTLTYSAAMTKKEVLEKLTRHINEKLNEGNASEFSAECKFAK
ncbi:MAG TPA: hypothetical protein VK435_00205 [Thermodesulfovibrionales bacterium]|nr:hypothetical protein [Thermodesulfovibrionales bacterium]